jgi:hypothetical protein
LTEAEFREVEDQYGDVFVVGMGAEAIKSSRTDGLQNLNDEIEQQWDHLKQAAPQARQAP